MFPVFFFYFCFLNYDNYVFANENKESKINYVLLEQPYLTVSKEELVNVYIEIKLNKKLKLNHKVSYNANPELYLNIEIKDAPDNLLGVYFDGGFRTSQNNCFTLTNLKEMSYNNDVKKVYFFYDNTDYFDVILHLKFEKNLYFYTFKKN